MRTVVVVWVLCTLSACLGFLLAALIGGQRIADLQAYIDELLNQEFSEIEDWLQDNEAS